MLNRREFLGTVGAAGVAAGVNLLQPTKLRAAVPTAPVAIARCKQYGPEFVTVLDRLFDQIGGIGNLVRGKTVSIKINMTGSAQTRLGYLPAGRTHWAHPSTVGSLIHLLDKYGARRVRVLEGEVWPGSLEEWMAKQGWDPDLLLKAGPRVELVNTNLPFKGKKPYTRFTVPHGGLIFPAYDLSTAYAESDVLISLAKLKEHLTAGFTLSIKNLWGVTPCTIYGNKAPEDEPGPIPYGGRQDIGHNGRRQPPKSAPPEKDPTSPRQDGYRIPRICAELSAAVPGDLAIIDGIETITGSEIPYARYSDFIKFVNPGVIAVGRNCVTTDAVGMALMGFDPMADRGTPPFELCDNMLRFSEELGVGTRDLRNIEVIGTPIKDVAFDFRKNSGPRPAGVPGGPPLPTKK